MVNQVDGSSKIKNNFLTICNIPRSMLQYEWNIADWHTIPDDDQVTSIHAQILGSYQSHIKAKCIFLKLINHLFRLLFVYEIKPRLDGGLEIGTSLRKREQ